jgi:hypothetical protein
MGARCGEKGEEKMKERKEDYPSPVIVRHG